ncbi:uncharacterized protein TNCV_4891031 [Trichonephila clavipes]|nr:uncharacterized protein TNCV_4891031 [Trichonephila clavipes]
MSLKILFSYFHLDFSPKNCGAISDGHSERFHQDIGTMERRYQGRWDELMLADYSWTAIKDTRASTYNPKGNVQGKNTADF